MSDLTLPTPPGALRAIVAADLARVRPLASPLVRGMGLLPLAALLLVAAPLTFDVRFDLARLGWSLGWAASWAQSLAGLALVVAALREAIPGRTWSRAGLAGWIVLTGGMLTAVTLAAYVVSPVPLRSPWIVGALCLAGSVVSALPAVALGSVLVARAWPVRPAIAGLLLGLGAGVMSDAGWRLFCHFSAPTHVLVAHAGGVAAAGAIGAWLTSRLCRSSAWPAVAALAPRTVAAPVPDASPGAPPMR